MPLPVPKPKVLELIEVNKHDKGKVDSATDEDRQRQVGTRKPSPRDCTTGSGVDCGRNSAPSVAVTSKRLATTNQKPADGNQRRQHQEQQQHSQKQQLTQQPQLGVQGRRPDQQQGKSHRPQQPQPLQATAGGEPQQAATERRGPRQKQQPPTTEAVAPQQKQQLPAVTINRWHGASAAITAVEQTKT
jgi:hypothetical protein